MNNRECGCDSQRTFLVHNLKTKDKKIWQSITEAETTSKY